MFSPYYAARRRRGPGEAEDHCAVNVAVYGPGARRGPRIAGRAGGKRWAMTERGRADLRQERDRLRIGPSGLAWEAGALTVDIDEWAVPIPARIRGRLRLEPLTRVEKPFALDAAGHHGWWPIAPCARVELELEQPALRWSGRAYLDSNHGTAPLEDAFAHWHWSRSVLEDGASAVLYDVTPRQGSGPCLALRFGLDGTQESFAPPPRQPLRTTGWRVRRETRSEGAAEVLETLEDTPFYARSVVRASLLGQRATGVHESLSLDRFRRGWVQTLLPFRMPRRGRSPA